MDEPLSNLDAKLRVQMRADIAKLQGELGDHDRLRHARPDRGDDDGPPRRGHEQGRPAAGRRAAAPVRPPENLFVAGFIGTPPMNLLEARLGERRRLGRPRRPRARDRGRGDQQYPRVREYNGRNVIVGLRPGDLHPAQGRHGPADRSRPASSSWSRSAASRWRTSRWTRARSRARRTRSTSRSPRRRARGSVVGTAAEPGRVLPAARPARLGDEVAVAVDTRNVHFFDGSVGCAAPLAARSRPSPRSRSAAPSRGSARPARRAARSSARSRSLPTQSSLASQRIYFVMPDRYANARRRTTPAASPARARRPGSTRPTRPSTTAATCGA